MSQYKIKFSPETIQILKLCSQINPSIKFLKGNDIKTVSTSTATLLEATISESFPFEFSIYELAKFLAVLNLQHMKDAELIFEDGINKVVIKSGKSSIDYYFTNEEFVTHPGKSLPNLPEVFSINFTQNEFDSLLKAASTLNHKIWEFKVEDNNLYIIATTPDIDSSNNVVTNFGPVECNDNSFKIKFEHVKLLSGDWIISVHLKDVNRGFVKFSHVNGKITEYVALEKI